MSAQHPSDDAPTAYRPPEETPTVVVSERSNRTLQFTPGQILGGRYRIVSLIGRGGMGEVYRADDLKLGQTVALKFVSHHGPVDRLYSEVRIGRQVSHPNVCRLPRLDRSQAMAAPLRAGVAQRVAMFGCLGSNRDRKVGQEAHRTDALVIRQFRHFPV